MDQVVVLRIAGILDPGPEVLGARSVLLVQHANGPEIVVPRKLDVEQLVQRIRGRWTFLDVADLPA